jgi:plasmid stability protein
MATLYVQNVPDDLYEALRRQAHRNGRSIASEVVSLLEGKIVTEQELKFRRDFVRRVGRLQLEKGGAAGPFPSSEVMQREERRR